MARKGIPYSRFSGKRQEAGDSQRRQDELAEAAAKAEGVDLDRTINLRDKGVSAFRGRNWKRGDLGKFLDLVDAGVIAKGTALIVEQVNRLSRMPWMQQVELWKEILSRGIVIRTCVPPARYTQANMNELAVGCPVVIYMMLAHLDSQQKSEWVSEAWGQKKQHAASEKKTPHGRHCPEWVKPVTKPHPRDPERVVTVAYEIIPERKALIEKIYRWVVENRWGAYRILRELNEKHLPAWNRSARAHAREEGGEPTWNVSWVKHILSTRQVVGEYQPLDTTEAGRVPDGAPVAKYYPAAVGEDLYLAVQAARRKRCRGGVRPGVRGGDRGGGRPGTGGMETNLFTGLVFEAMSRRPFYVTTCITGGVPYRYLATDPEVARIPYGTFERAVLRAVAALRASDVDGRHKADEFTSEVARLQAEVTRLKEELAALDAQTDGLDVTKWPPRVVARMVDLKSQFDTSVEALRVAKERADTSGRTEALTEVQTCVELLDEVRGMPREAGVRERIKRRLPLLLESVWAVVQPINRVCRIVHVRLYLHGGEQRPLTISIGNPKKGWPEVWELRDADFRGGDVGGHAVHAQPLAEVVADAMTG
jgi:DNA invertase Pin-like site-specific DNA recombinase